MLLTTPCNKKFCVKDNFIAGMAERGMGLEN
jgi:hypothetical protein